MGKYVHVINSMSGEVAAVFSSDAAQDARALMVMLTNSARAAKESDNYYIEHKNDADGFPVWGLFQHPLIRSRARVTGVYPYTRYDPVLHRFAAIANGYRPQ